MQYALKYYEKDVLTEEDMGKVQNWFEETEESEDVDTEEPEEVTENEEVEV